MGGTPSAPSALTAQPSTSYFRNFRAAAHTDPEEDFRSGVLQRLAALLDAGKMQRNRGESIAEALRRRLNRMTEEQVSRMLDELESGKPS